MKVGRQGVMQCRVLPACSLALKITGARPSMLSLFLCLLEEEDALEEAGSGLWSGHRP